MFKLDDPSLFRGQCFVNGEWLDADSKQTINVDNPSTGAIIGTVPSFGKEEVNRAIDGAYAAFAEWKKLLPSQRAAVLVKWNALIQENKMDLARILSYENGKSVNESLGEIALGSSYIPWYAEECRRLYGEVIPAPRKGVRPMTHLQPVGVVYAATPWNFPSSMITRKCAPALAAGCPVIIKPASATPFSAIALAVLAERAGFPKGVFNVVTGVSKVISEAMGDSEKVRFISFTGSTKVGQELLTIAAKTLKGTAMELGGNAPFLVFDDADMNTALNFGMGSKFRNAGQTCISSNRYLVQEGIAPEFTRLITERIAKLKIGDAFEEGSEVGPMVTHKAIERIERLLADAKAKGAKIILGGKVHARGGNYFEPTVITGITPDMDIFNTEIFGPVVPIMTFKTEEEAIKLANQTPFGLACYVMTQNLGRAFRVSEKLQYGLCGVNDSALAMAEVPFGGVKHSGHGKEGGREGILDYMETRYVLMGGIGD